MGRFSAAAVRQGSRNSAEQRRQEHRRIEERVHRLITTPDEACLVHRGQPAPDLLRGGKNASEALRGRPDRRRSAGEPAPGDVLFAARNPSIYNNFGTPKKRREPQAQPGREATKPQRCAPAERPQDHPSAETRYDEPPLEDN